MSESDEIEIDLRELFFVLLSKLHILILAFLLGASAMYFVSIAFLPQEFESTTSIYVLSKQDNNVVTYSDLQTGTQLTKDYAELVKSRSVMEQVITRLKLDSKYPDMRGITSERLSSMVSVKNTTDTRIISITVRDTNPARAQDIANAVREVASIHITEVMDIRAVNVVDYAEMPISPVGPRTKFYTLVGALVMTFIAAGIIVLFYMMDDTIKSPDDVEKYLGISVLSSIPLDENLVEDKKKRQKVAKAKAKKNKGR
ncbi:MAG TPA: protein-tyrosine kinase [Lachnospiraceae bacterium]|nr:protein-tyrosine kinase [Lachnospiraceae bacterium]